MSRARWGSHDPEMTRAVSVPIETHEKVKLIRDRFGLSKMGQVVDLVTRRLGQ
jgi:hypothetical protein